MVRFSKYASACVLCVVALTQLIRGIAFNQTPWKGGGFGMFSTVDSRSARYIRAFLQTSSGEVAVTIPAELDDEADLLYTSPSQRRLDALAEKVASAPWIDKRLFDAGRDLPLASGAALDPVKLSPPDTGDLRPLARGKRVDPAQVVQVRSARLELWKYVFDKHAGELRGKCLLRSHWKMPDGSPPD